MSRDAKQFGKVRSFFWPIHAYELKKLVPMQLIFFLVSFCFNMLRGMKDSLIVTADVSGAETIPYIKVWGMLPGALLLTYIFTKLSNRYSRENVFYIMLSIFLTFFVIFAIFLYPNIDTIHPHKLAAILTDLLPKGSRGLIAMLHHWSFTIFYVMSELWGSILLSLLCWGFANDITKVSEAARFYGVITISLNFSSIFSGQLGSAITKHFQNASPHFGYDAWGQAVITQVSVVVLCGLIVAGIYRWMHVYVLPNKSLYPNYHTENSAAAKKKRSKMSLRDSFGLIAKSRYLLYIAVIVVVYNLVINLVEVVWKDQVKQLYPIGSDYNIYMNHVTTMTGIVATIIALFIQGNTIRRYGWTFTAMITPAILFVTSIGFFGMLLFGHNLSGVIISLLGSTSLMLTVLLGSIQNVLSRGSKYTVFDSTKEIAFIPLGREERMRGKSAIDGVISRMGKSGGSVIYQILLNVCGSLAASVPYVAGMLLGIIIVWLIATKALGKQVTTLINQQEDNLSSQEDTEIAKKPSAQAI
ncbi:MAG: Npt1/Npt2 family nucleotide transporter [Chlamydiota bacterium]